MTNTYTFNLTVGYNYISMPQIPQPADSATIFGVYVETWRWNHVSQEWELNPILTCKEGYLLRVFKPRTITISGTDCIVTVEDLIAIYNSLAPGKFALVGPGIEELDIKGTELEGHVYQYDYANKKYYYTDLLEVTKGYWIEKPTTTPTPTPTPTPTHKTTAEFFRFALTKEVPLDTDDVCIAKCVVRNSGTDEGTVYFKLDELNSDGSVKNNICALSRTVDLVRCYSPMRDCVSRDVSGRCRAYSCRIGTYGGCEHVPLHDLRVTTPAEAGTYYYGIKTWGEGEAEPSYPVPDSANQPVNVKAWSVVCKMTPTPTPTPSKKKVRFEARDENDRRVEGVKLYVDSELKGET